MSASGITNKLRRDEQTRGTHPMSNLSTSQDFQFEPSKVKEKRVSYLLMETLKKITLKFMEVMVWMQCIKERMVV